MGNNNSHEAIDYLMKKNSLEPKNIKNQVKSNTVDLYGLFDAANMFNMGTAVYSGKTKGGDQRFYMRDYFMPSSYYDDESATKEFILMGLRNAISKNLDDTTSTKEIQDLYKFHKLPMPKYKKGGKVISRYGKEGRELNNLINKLNNYYANFLKETNLHSEGYSQESDAYPVSVDTQAERERANKARLLKEYLAGAVSEEPQSSDVYSIFNPRHPDFIGF